MTNEREAERARAQYMQAAASKVAEKRLPQVTREIYGRRLLAECPTLQSLIAAVNSGKSV